MNSVILACWLIFLAIWLAAAAQTKSTAEPACWRDQLSYRLPFAVTIVLLLASSRIPVLAIQIVSSTPATHFLAASFCVIGLVFAIWARAALGSNWSSAVTFKQSHELITGGPYRFVRHPIYTGVLLMLLGSALMQARLGSIAGLAFGVAGMWLKLQREETLLLAHFRSEYTAYRARTKALIPFVL